MRLLIPLTVLGLITAIAGAIPAPSYDVQKPLPTEVTNPAPIEIEGIGPGALVLQGGGSTPPGAPEPASR